LKPLLPVEVDLDDPIFLERSLAFFNWMFEHYFRVKVIGLEHLPSGASLLVSNHGGFIPWDGAMIHAAIWRESGRHPRFLVTSWAFTVKGLGGFLRRTGNVPASPETAARLLAQGEIVGTFPEGVAGVAKPGGRGGRSKADLAPIRTGAISRRLRSPCPQGTGPDRADLGRRL